eukprot:1069858-Amphidinium_carterae.3
MRELGVRDGATLANVEMISKHLLATLRNRSRELMTTKVALKIPTNHSSNKDKPSALAAGAPSSPGKPPTQWTCKYFTSDEGCKKGKACDAKHLPKDKGCTNCGSLRHDAKKCERPTKKSNQPKDSGDVLKPEKLPLKKKTMRMRNKLLQNRLQQRSKSQEESSQSSVGAMALVHCEDDVPALAAKTGKTPMFLDPTGKPYALADCGATNVTLNVKHLPAKLRDEATKP